MKGSPQSSAAECRAQESGHTERLCKIVIFWEDFDAAIRARGAYDSIVRGFSAGRLVDSRSWSFRMLEAPEFNASVLMDTATADVIVVAARGAEELPARVASWLEICMMRHENAGPVLVALHEDGFDPDGAAAPLCTSLQGIADRQGAGFACGKHLKVHRNRKASSRAIHDRPHHFARSREATHHSAASIHQ